MIFEKNDRIIFAGDSVTDMGRVFPHGEGYDGSLGGGFVALFDNFLYACYPELDLRITNAGTGGNTSRDLVARFQADVADRAPDWVMICIGINDVWRKFDMPAFPEAAVGIEDYRKNLEQMINMINGKVKGFFILSPYIMEPCKDDIMRKDMDEYVEVCRDLAEKYSVPFIDFQAMFDRFFRYHHSSMTSRDRIHPNKLGNMLMAKEVLKHCGFDFEREI